MFCGLPSSVMKINVRHQLSSCTTIFCSQQSLMLDGNICGAQTQNPEDFAWKGFCPKRGTWSVPCTQRWHGGPGGDVPTGQMELVCCSDFPEVFISHMDQPLQSVRHGITFPMDNQTKFHMHFSCRNNNAFLAIWNHFPIHTRALKLSGGKGKHGKINQKWLFIFECVILKWGGPNTQLLSL